MKILIITSLFFLLSCSHTQDEKISFSPNDLIIDTKREYQEVLTEEQAKYDVELLIYALENGYGGRKFVPENKLSIVLKKLKEIPYDFNLSLRFCNKIGKILLELPDNHMNAKLNNRLCGGKDFKQEGDVGKNIHHGNKKPWAINFRKGIPIISIIRMPLSKDKSWNGFIKEIIKLRESDSVAFIIDFRGNGGGDDTKGHQMCGYFYG